MSFNLIQWIETCGHEYHSFMKALQEYSELINPTELANWLVNTNRLVLKKRRVTKIPNIIGEMSNLEVQP